MRTSINNLTKLDPEKFAYSKEFLISRDYRLGFSICGFLFVLLFGFFKFFPSWSFEHSNITLSSDLFTIVLYTSIYSLAIWAIVLVVKAISKIEIESAIAIVLNNGTSSELSAIRGKQKQRIELDQIEDSFFPDNPNSDLSMLRLGRLVIEEAKDRKFDSAVVLMDPYKEESVSELYKINVIQKAALHLGILGTFIGLIAAFTGLGSNMLSSDSLITEIIPSLEYSFKTSIAGLLATIVISFFMILARRKQDDLFKHMEDATNSLLSLARNSINRDDFISEFNQINESVRHLDERVYDQTQEVHNQTKSIGDGLLRLGKVNEQFNGFLKDLTNREKVFLDEVKEFHKILSPKTISEELKVNMEKSVEGINAMINDDISRKIKRYDELDKSVSEINHSLIKVASNLEKQEAAVQVSMNHFEKSKESFDSALVGISESQEDFIGKITGSHFSEKVRNDFKEIASEFSKSFSSDLRQLNTSVNMHVDQLNAFNSQADKYFSHRLKLEKSLFVAGIILVTITGSILVFKIFAG